MSAPSDWGRVERALDEVLDRSLAERDDWLERVGRTDPALARDVERFLAALDASPGFLERPVAACAAELVATSLDEVSDDISDDAPLPTATIGPYRLIRELGRGGMGTVYLAERNDGEFTKAVAIKMVRFGTGLAGDSRRFQTERQILASLDHPGVARLLDGGTTPDGIAYLVMEYVEGESIDRYVAGRALSVDGRLALFDRVADAVEYAHRQLVVHRDLKPGNILVSAAGEVKLLDFGIAKLLDVEPGSDATRTGVILATPAYASPEQIRGEPVSTASDVYALGVVLHHMLTERSPYRVGAEASPRQLAAAICDEIPDRPSVTVTDPALRRRLAGDLDAIMLTALAKETDRRYQSVTQLRDDLRRHRDGFPVVARPPTRAYLAGKFVARHRGKLLAAALVVLALAAGATVAAWQARAAVIQAERAERVTRFVKDIFGGTDPDRSQGREVSARELLDQGAARLATELTEEPAVRAEMLAVVATLYQRLGLPDSAARLLERAIQIDEASGAAELDRAARLAALASVRFDLGDYQATESLATAALTTRRRLLGARDPRITTSLADVATARSVQGDYGVADSLFRVVLALERRRGDSAAAARTTGLLGQVLWRQGRYDEAVPLLEDVLAFDRRVHGEVHTYTATSLQHLGSVLMDQGAFDSATILFERAIAVREQLLGPEHPLVASALGNLADLYQKHGKLEPAERANLRALAIRRSAYGDSHPEVALSHNNLAVVHYFLGRHRDAAEGFERTLAIWRPLLGDQHSSVLTGLNNLGSAYRSAGNLVAAERILEEVLAIRIGTLGESHQDVAQSRNNLALLHAEQGKHREAEAGFAAATRIWRSTLGERHPNVAYGLISHGRFLSDRGRCVEGEPLLRDAVALREAALDPASPDLAMARRELAICLSSLGRSDEAIVLLDLAIPVMRDTWGPEGDGTRRAVAARAEAAGRR